LANRLTDTLARIGGADKDILDDAPQDRGRFVQMAGILFTTSGIATLSMSFALHNGVRVPLYAAIVFAVFWGFVIFNIDRFLVLSMGDTRTRGWRLLFLMVPRFVLAALLAAVVSTPLVLRIFASDINQQLSIMHQEQSRHFAELVKHNGDEQQADAVAAKISADQAILNGYVHVVNRQLQGDTGQVKTLAATASRDFTAERKAYETWQCELDGEKCGGASGVAGNGGRAHTDYLAYVQARSTYNTAAAALRSTQQTENKEAASFARYEQQRKQLLQAQARRSLPGLQREYNTIEARIARTIANGDAVNSANVGILAQLQALSQASAADPGLEAARWTVLALFFVIEILPVTVKALLNLGSQTAYEKVAIGREEQIADREDLRKDEYRRIEKDESDARVEKVKKRLALEKLESEVQRKIIEAKADSRINVQDDMREREQVIGKHANRYVADQMKQIIDSALAEWGNRIRETLLSSDPVPQDVSPNGQHADHEQQGIHESEPAPPPGFAADTGFTPEAEEAARAERHQGERYQGERYQADGYFDQRSDANGQWYPGERYDQETYEQPQGNQGSASPTVAEEPLSGYELADEDTI
jgi:hypothetical protein